LKQTIHDNAPPARPAGRARRCGVDAMGDAGSAHTRQPPRARRTRAVRTTPTLTAINKKTGRRACGRPARRCETDTRSAYERNAECWGSSTHAANRRRSDTQRAGCKRENWRSGQAHDSWQGLHVAKRAALHHRVTQWNTVPYQRKNPFEQTPPSWWAGVTMQTGRSAKLSPRAWLPRLFCTRTLSVATSWRWSSRTS
jgi:hypothetical protein